VQIAMLGPLEVRAGDGGLVELGGARLRTLLIRLALDPGRVVTTSALIDALWEDAPPVGAANALQALVSRLRRALPDGTVESQPAGYRLRVPPDAIDVRRFEREVATGRARLAADPLGAAATLGAALALWRGPALADVAEAPFARAAVAHLTELRLAAAEDRADAALAAGDGADLVPELAALAHEHPLRERLAARLMRVLSAAGRPAEALEAYERLRVGLAESLGTDPSPELAALHVALLRDPPPPSEDGPQSNLPAALTSFVGRNEDVRRVTKLVGEARLTTLTGPGGAGKTRLAIESARVASGQAPDGVWLVEFAPVTDAAELASVVLTALGLREQALVNTRGRVQAEPTDPLARLTGALGSRRALLVLDNCEHLVDAAARLADGLLSRCPRLRVLATSREPLGITGESLYPVEPLPLPPAGTGVGDALEYPAVRLFADRAAAVRPGFRVTDPVLTICRALDGMPLAIELAAARLRAMTTDQLATRLGDRFRLLAAGSRTALPRHQTLRAVVDWSWELLDEPERALLRRLAVFAGGATPEAVEAVCGGDPDLLYALVDKSLVVADADGRYRLLETIKAYGLERLAEAGEAEATRRAHARHFLRLAQSADRSLRTRDQLDWLARLDADHDNLASAMRWAIGAGDANLAVRFADALGWYWWLRGRRAEGAELAEEALALPGDVPPALVAGAASIAALNVVAGLFQIERGEELLLQAAELAVGREDRHPMLSLVGPMAKLFGSPPDNDVALAGLRRCFDHPAAWVRGVARMMYGHAEVNIGRRDNTSAENFALALAEFRSVGDRWGIATTLSALAELTARYGDHARAAAYFEESLAELVPLGVAEDVPEMQARYAYQLWLIGEPHRALAELENAQRTADRLGTDEARASVGYHLGATLHGMGDLDGAQKHLARALQIVSRFNSSPQWPALINTALGLIEADRGDLAAAERHHQDALDLAILSRDAPVIGHAVVGHVDLAIRRDQPVWAAKLLGVADAVRGGPDLSLRDGPRVEQAVRERLGEAEFAEAFESGQSATVETLREFVPGHPSIEIGAVDDHDGA
jgi:predicted ATPase/DNA-binding SARP family transcriptional activator